MTVWKENATRWVQGALRDAMPRLQKFAGKKMMPVVEEGRRTILAEYGCGHYGCVLPVKKRNVVLKLTSDPTEAAFASMIIGSPDLADVNLEGLIHYYRIAEIEGQTRRGRPLWAIWREEAYEVGTDYTLRGYHIPRWLKVLDQYSSHASTVFRYLQPRKAGAEKRLELMAQRQEWADRWAQQGTARYLKGAKRAAVALQLALWSAQELSGTEKIYHVGQTLWELIEVGVLLADTHMGNLGHVDRDEDEPGQIVITDPGHALLLRPDIKIPKIRVI